MLSIPAFHTPCPFAMNASRWTVLGRRCLPRWTRGAALCLGAAVAAPLVPWRRNTTAWCQGERSLFPEIEARKSGRLETKDGSCSLYYEVSGNPKGKVALFLHGGPGDGCSPKHRRLFDPEAFCIVIFDQRGAGQSSPPGFNQHNKTENLVQDIEQLREDLGFEAWDLIVGGSWGSTLALAYATKFPELVKALVLYSIFIPSQESIDFVYSPQGAGLFFPEAYESFVKALPSDERSNLIGSYAKRLDSPDLEVRRSAMSSYLRWILRLLSVSPDEAIIEEIAQKPDEAGYGPSIEMNYMANGCFMDAQQLLADCFRIGHIPCTILHGRNDLICPPANAWLLRQRLPLAQLKMVPLAGHSSSFAPALKSAILEAIDSYR
ncbi:unnamed protein product [Cladocopium goreaui]|uniref:Proline iminopeptidase n=1 Tax=Cladocopium goreaui TaxID=2562237 RepID=A0A9P1FQZ1_9DINO|nr:unnamed protein product [Cladocopium goreaui]